MSFERKLKKVKEQISILHDARQEEEERTKEMFSDLFQQLDHNYDKMHDLILTAEYELAAKRYIEREEPESPDPEETEDMGD